MRRRNAAPTWRVRRRSCSSCSSPPRRAGTRLPDLKVFICGGASVPPSLIRRATAYFERAVGHAGLRIHRGARDDGRRARRPRRAPPTPTAGRASPTSGSSQRRRHRPAAGRSARAARRCSSATCTRRTKPNPSTPTATSAPAISARWVGRSLVVTGRAKDIIIRNGENISPKEVEDILIGHPGIAEVAVVGLPDARTGERACAVHRRPRASQVPTSPRCASSSRDTASRRSKCRSRWPSGMRCPRTTQARC